MRRSRPLYVLAVLALAACESSTSKSPPPTPSAAAVAPASASAPQEPATPEGPRLPIDPQTSPIEFQWLASDAVLVAPELGKRELAEFGNYVARAAKEATDAELSVYTDAEAWQQEESEPQKEVPKRAEYAKRSGADKLERFAIFDADGKVIYERDFRNYPLTAADP